MSHIPQPATTAPSEQVLSTDENIGSAGVSGIDLPDVKPAESMIHVGQVNALDPILYSQQIFSATFPWNTKDEPGKCLWFTEITPLKANKILATLASIYNCWTGGIEFMFKVAGTGFHAGAVTIVKIPPNFHPSEFSGTKDWSAFPWQLYDPKMLEVCSVIARDQRPVTYHYTNAPNGQPDSWDIGGWLAVYVDMSLNTSSSGSQTIQVNVWAKPAPDFRFLQLRIPRDDIKNDNMLMPTALTNALDFSAYIKSVEHIASAPRICDKLVILPALTKQLNQGLYNCYDLNGFPLSTFTQSAQYINYGDRNTFALINWYTGEGDKKFVQVAPLDDFLWDVQTISDKAVLMSVDNMCQTVCVLGHGPKTSITTGGIVLELQVTELHEDWPGPFYIEWKWNSEKNLYTEPVAISAKTSHESFVIFQAQASKELRSVQTHRMSELFRTTQISRFLTPSQCALLMLVDTTENLPIGYAKLYKEGFLTMAESTDQVEFWIKNLRFVFSNFLQRTDQIPVKPEYSTNRMLLTMKYRSSMKSSRKLQRD